MGRGFSPVGGSLGDGGSQAWAAATGVTVWFVCLFVFSLFFIYKSLYLITSCYTWPQLSETANGAL